MFQEWKKVLSRVQIRNYYVEVKESLSFRTKTKSEMDNNGLKINLDKIE